MLCRPSCQLRRRGDAVAQYYLGLMFDAGEGVRADPVQARQWYQRAAQSGHSDAQFRLGRLYADGKGVPVNGNTASYWYLQAAGQGNLDAQYSLGAMFKQGKGVPVDLVTEKALRPELRPYVEREAVHV